MKILKVRMVKLKSETQRVMSYANKALVKNGAITKTSWSVK